MTSIVPDTWRIRMACLLLMASAACAAHASDARYDQAMAAFRSGQYADAVRDFEAALQSYEAALGERDVKTMATMSNLASAYAGVGRTAERLALNRRALRLRTEVLGERHVDTLASMNNLAGTYRFLGRVSEQLELAEKALPLRIEVQGERHPDTLTAMSNLAVTYGAAGRLADELKLTERALHLRTEVLGERHRLTLVSMNNLATTYAALGRQGEKVPLDEKVLRLRVEELGERDPDTLMSMSNLAAGYGILGRQEERLALDEKVLRLRTEVLGERAFDTMLSMSNLAITLGDMGRHAEQLELAEKSLRLRTEVLGERSPYTVQSMANVATALGALGRRDEQLTMNQAALQMFTEVLGLRHPDTLKALQLTAAGLLAAARPRDAASLTERYVDGAEWQRSQPGLSAENRQSVFAAFAAGYRFFSTIHGGLGEFAAGLQLAELGKARTLLEGMASQRASRYGALPETERDRLDILSREITSVGEALARARTVEERERHEAARNRAAREYEAQQSRLKTEYPKFAQLSDVKIVGLADLPAVLPEDAVAVSYVVSGSELGVYVVQAKHPARYLALGSLPHLADAVDLWRRAQADERPLPQVLAEDGLLGWRLADGSYRLLGIEAAAPQGATPLADARELGAFLSARLLLPLATSLQSRPRWIISPDGPLAQLPFETLPFGPAGQAAIAAADIHYTQSLSVYALSRELQKQYESLLGRRSLFAMGNPEYRASTAGATQRRQLKREVPLRVAQQLADLDLLWEPLPGTEAEVKAVARLFPGSTSVYLGEQASERQLQALNAAGELKNYRYLLLSAHGYLSPDQPALSSIVLSMTQRTPEADGYVTASEWPGYDLRSDLAVLSACNSGVGRVVGGEGVMGLPFAMFVAGNVNTVLSLWPVADEATAEFVTALFARLKAGQPAARALAATKREFVRHERFSHPQYWAPFILVGAG